VDSPLQVPLPGMDFNKSRAYHAPEPPAREVASFLASSLQQQLASLLSVEIAQMQRAYPKSAFGQALVADSLINQIIQAGSMSTEEDVHGFARYVAHLFKNGRQPGYATGPTGLGLLVSWAADCSALKKRQA
jgi:hypothetical protein